MNLKKIHAKDIMSEHIVAVPADMILKDAAHLMLRDRISGLPVVNAKRKIIGILTLTDLFKIIDKVMVGKKYDFIEGVLRCEDFTVAQVMTPEVLTISSRMTLDGMIKVMLDKKVHTLPVMQGKKLVGIVGRHDILNAVYSFS